MILHRGSVVLLDLSPTVGHEQRGVRPCVVASDLVVAADQRFGLVAVVPVTSTPGVGTLYPPVTTNGSGLSKSSWALTDQIRSVDKRRIGRLLGRVADEHMESIDAGLRLFLGLSRWG